MNLKHIAKDAFEAEELARKNPDEVVHFPGGAICFTHKLPKASHGAFVVRSA